jgi:hypothetical protein
MPWTSKNPCVVGTMIRPTLQYLKHILIKQYYENIKTQMVNSAETGLFAIAAAMSGFVRYPASALSHFGSLQAAAFTPSSSPNMSAA